MLYSHIVGLFNKSKRNLERCRDMMKMQKSLSVISLAGIAAALLVACAIMAALLAACGDEATTVPAANAPANGQPSTQAANPSGNSTFFVVSGATTTNVPDTLKAALAQYEAQYPGSKAQAFKTGAPAAT